MPGDCVRTSSTGKRYRDNLVAIAKETGAKLNPIVQQHCPGCGTWHQIQIDEASVIRIAPSVDAAPPGINEVLETYHPKPTKDPAGVFTGEWTRYPNGRWNPM